MGSDRGRYVRAYADLLDGIAHLRAAQTGLSEGYFADAFDKLRGAWTQSQDLAGEDLEAAAAAWLTVLARAAAGPRLEALRTNVEGFLTSIGGAATPGGEPAVPWFAEPEIFVS
jgi:hypothetical protein